MVRKFTRNECVLLFSACLYLIPCTFARVEPFQLLLQIKRELFDQGHAQIGANWKLTVVFEYYEAKETYSRI